MARYSLTCDRQAALQLSEAVLSLSNVVGSRCDKWGQGRTGKWAPAAERLLRPLLGEHQKPQGYKQQEGSFSPPMDGGCQLRLVILTIRLLYCF